MRRLLVGVLVGLAVGPTGAPADDERQAIIERPKSPLQAQAARTAARDYLAPLLSTPTHDTQVRLSCGPGRCAMRAFGSLRCLGTIRTSEDRANVYAWFSRLNCR